MDIADISIDQELVYTSPWPKSRPGPRIRITKIQNPGDPATSPSQKVAGITGTGTGYGCVIGIVLDTMGSIWDKGSEFLCLPEHLERRQP